MERDSAWMKFESVESLVDFSAAVFAIQVLRSREKKEVQVGIGSGSSTGRVFHCSAVQE